MAATSSSYHLLNHIFRTPPPSTSAFRSFYFRRPSQALRFLSSASTFASPQTAALNLLITRSSRHYSDSMVRSRSICKVSVRSSTSQHVLEEEFINDEEEQIYDCEIEDGIAVDDEDEIDATNEVVKVAVVDRSTLPKLTIKEKKELASYAHSLGKKLKVQLVGKSGVTPSLASSFVETLEANELLKIKIHATCPGETPDVAKQLEDATGSVVVGQIGRTVILYRPSLSKMKAEEKRRQERKVFVRKNSVFKPKFPLKGGIPKPAEQTPRPNRRGTRGSSRMRTPE